MNDNYLWDRSGEPDTEIQKLEEMLGTFRYQPRPLEIPAELKPQRKRTFIPWAIAAAIALLIIAAGLWRLSHSQASTPLEVRSEAPAPPKPIQSPSFAPPNEKVASTGNDKVLPRRKHSTPLFVANNPRRERPIESRRPQLSEEELAQKEQLVMALRLVSAKLNVAQRKVQGQPQSNIIRNQHKIG